MTSLDTRSKILETAKELFAKKGPKAVSIRELAKEADVNLAAINYHFGSKGNLLSEVFNSGYEELRLGVKELLGTLEFDFTKPPVQNLETFIYGMLEHFRSEKNTLFLGFIIILTEDNGINDQDLHNQLTEIGPPGGDTLIKFITKIYGEDIPLDQRTWASWLTFHHCGQLCMALESSTLRHKVDIKFKRLGFTPKKSIKYLAKSIDAFLGPEKNS